MNIMSCRLIALKNIFLGYQKTGIPLIEFDGTKLTPSFPSDDIGIYVLIPKIATLFNLNIEQAINFFFYSILFVPPLIGIIGFLLYYQSTLQRIIAVGAMLLLTRQAYALGDVYLAYFACVTALVPWSLYFYKRKKYDRSLLLYLFFAGIWIGFFNYIRTYSGIGVGLFILTLFSLKYKAQWLKKISFTGIMFLGIAVPYIFFSNAYNTYKTYAQEQLVGFSIGEKNHVFWHNIYIGFGFLKYGNPDDITYDDNFGTKTVQNKVPGITLKGNTPEYERTLKNEVLNLFKNHLQFVLFTLFAKIGILLFYLIKFANIGLLAAFFYRKPWQLELPFWIGMSFYSLFSILTMPFMEYALGFISLAALYGIISINYALNQGLLNRPVRKRKI